MINVIESSTLLIKAYQQKFMRIKHKLTEFVAFSKYGSEYEQGIIRLVIISLIMVYLNVYYEALKEQIPIFWTFFLFLSLGLLAHIKLNPAQNLTRQKLALSLDLLGTSYSVHITGEIGAVFIGVYLWLIIGYGLRYGKKTMLVAYFASIACFSLAYTTNPYWQSHMPFFYGLLITLIGVPLHTMGLLTKLKQATTKAELASQAKTQFLSHMSHEIRTPLNGIVGACNLITDNQSNSDQKALLDVVKSSSELLVQLVSNVLDLSEIESGKFNSRIENFNLNALLDNVVKLFKPQTDLKNVVLSFALKNETPIMLKGEALHIKQVLVNLVGNAVKFTASGSITIIVQTLTQSDGDVTIRFEVVDSGMGIPQTSLSTIFEQFTQADDSIKYQYGGTGLGTAISKRLVNLMGGKIGVESIEKQGSKFWFEIPLQKNISIVSHANVAVLDDFKKSIVITYKPIRILVAEDNAVNSMILKQVLQNAHHEVDVVVNGSLALDHLEANQYDLMILDSNMPVMGGIEALQLYRTLNIGQTLIPAIIFSADATKSSMDRAFEVGASAYLTKPVENDELLVLINSLTNIKAFNQVPNITEFKQSRTTKKPVIYLDIDRINSLRLLSKDNTFYEKLSKDFIVETQANIKQIKLALQNEDFITVSAFGHSIAGSATNLGLIELHNLARVIDNVSPALTMPKIYSNVNQLEAMFEQTQLELAQYFIASKNKPILTNIDSVVTKPQVTV